MPQDKPVSIRDVARMANVSTATVSRVINDNGRFSEATRQRVLQAIRTSGYITNAAAKSLRESRSKTIGMIVPDIANHFFATLVQGCEQYLSRLGYAVFICNSGNEYEREQSYLRMLESKRVDGIICISGSHELDDRRAPRAIPLVCIDRYPGPDSSIPRVISDDVRGGFLATRHLAERGCERILFLSSKREDLNKRNREQGYDVALGEFRLPSYRSYNLYRFGEDPSADVTEKLRQAFSHGARPFDGIFAVSDNAAVGALRSLAAAGVRVPEEVKIVGFDDSVNARITTPQLTSIHRYPERLAEKGCEILLSLITGARPQRETVIPVELVERASSR